MNFAVLPHAAEIHLSNASHTIVVEVFLNIHYVYIKKLFCMYSISYICIYLDRKTSNN